MSTRRRSRDDFHFGRCIGCGAFSEVFIAQLKSKLDSIIAIKVMNKGHIRRNHQVDNVRNEIAILALLQNEPSSKFIVSLEFAFHDAESFYIGLELVAGGNLVNVIESFCPKRLQCEVGNVIYSCPMEVMKFLAAEMVEALDFIHSRKVVHRDLNPKNILITVSGHLKVADFGYALQFKEGEGGAIDVLGNSRDFVGTAEYIAPETLDGVPASPACDMWALGCLAYLLAVGCSPFSARRCPCHPSSPRGVAEGDVDEDEAVLEYAVYQAIRQYCGTSKERDAAAALPPPPPSAAASPPVSAQAQPPSPPLSPMARPEWLLVAPEAQSLILGLLVPSACERLGCVDERLRTHAFFADTPWGSLHARAAPYTPAPIPGSDLAAVVDVPPP